MAQSSGAAAGGGGDVPRTTSGGGSGSLESAEILKLPSNSRTNIASKRQDAPSPRGNVNMSEMTREEMDARLDAGVSKVETVEARISATLEEFSSDNKIFKKDVTSSLALMAAEIKHLPTTWTMISAIGASSVAVITIVLGVIAFGGDRFDGGVQVTSASAQQAIEAQQLARENSEQIRALATRAEKNDTQLEAIYKALVGNGGGKMPAGQNE